jgi:ABC-type nitrate/sulfonate/bicarbonate transport system substrate-binding protein
MYRLLSVSVLGSLLLALAACGSSASPPAAPAAAKPTAPAAAPAPAQAAAPPAAAPTSRPAPATVRVGTTPLLTASGLYVALERGYFAEQGIELVMENISDPTAMVPSLATG